MKQICILNFNCLNLKTRLEKLKILLADTVIQKCHVLHCNTCFDEHTDLAFHSIPGYTLISDAYRISSHFGVALYLNNDFSYERKLNIE